MKKITFVLVCLSSFFVSASLSFAENSTRQDRYESNFVPALYEEHTEDCFISTIGINHIDGPGLQLWVYFTAGDDEQNISVIKQYSSLLNAFKSRGYFTGKGNAQYLAVGTSSSFGALNKGGIDYEMNFMPVGPSVVYGGMPGYDRSREVAKQIDVLQRSMVNFAGLGKDYKQDSIAKLQDFEKRNIDYFGPIVAMTSGNATYSLIAHLEVSNIEQNIQAIKMFNKVYKAFKDAGFRQEFKVGKDNYKLSASIVIGVKEKKLYQGGDTISIYPMKFGEIHSVEGKNFVAGVFDALEKK